mmetsp:Transcript_25158/g.29640  ORF Transcript_25158/g.29640 Transcript_25158/m.29640 type:complete len:87 (-) Transcript_25158:1001-1261(-)
MDKLSLNAWIMLIFTQTTTKRDILLGVLPDDFFCNFDCNIHKSFFCLVKLQVLHFLSVVIRANIGFQKYQRSSRYDKFLTILTSIA